MHLFLNLGYIDLSKRRVDPEDIVKCEERYNKAKAVHSVLRHVAEVKKLRLETLYEQIGWPLYRKYRHAYDAFKMALNDVDQTVDIFEGLEITADVKDALQLYIKRRLAPQPVKIRADIEVTCFTYDGIDAIKEALTTGESVGGVDTAVKIKLIAPPMYVMTTMTLDKDQGIEAMTQAIERVTACILEKGYDC